MDKMSSQPGKCINQDLQDPNQIKWMITTGAGAGGGCKQEKKQAQQDSKATGLKSDAIRQTTEIN